MQEIEQVFNSIDWSMTIQYVVPTVTFLVGYYLGRKTSVGAGLHNVAKAIRYHADKTKRQQADITYTSNTLPFDE